MNKIQKLAGLAVAVFLTACHKAPSAEAVAAAAPKAAEAKVIRGGTTTATERSFPRFLRVSGQLAAQQDAVLTADAAGRVMTTLVERGSIVKVGDVLATLDERQPKLVLAEATASVGMAKARLALAKNEQERNKPLAEKKAIADADYQKLLTEVAAGESELAAAEARQAQAKKALDDCTIRALFNGVVSERMVDIGEYVRPDAPVARVVDMQTLRLVLAVPETEVGALKAGQAVEFSTAAYPGKNFQGTLKFLGAALREASRDLVVEAAVDNADGALRPGLFCDAHILLREEKGVAVPTDALRIEGTRRKVFVVGQDNTLYERLVEVGEVREAFTEIHRGVATGEKVLVKPSPEATDGLRFESAQ